MGENRIGMIWAPQRGPQEDAIAATMFGELFFGGAAGGGKSDFLLGDFLQDMPTYSQAWRGILLRRTYPELEELMARAAEVYPMTGAAWNEVKRTWRWPNGANLKMRYCETDNDALRYQGHQYTWVGWDELTQWPSLFPYRYLRGRLRSAHKVPTKRIRAAGNPGGPGHLEVKSYFIDPAPLGHWPIMDPETGMDRIFIPSRLSDNAILLKNDPSYAGRLRGLGGNLARAMLDGDWNIIEGAYFDTWDAARNIVAPFEIPPDWTRFRSFDWGSAKPFSAGWWAICPDPLQAANVFGEPMTIPRGAIVRYREWYGCKTGTPNVGLKLTAEEVAQGIVERERGERITYGVADPAIFTADGGPSIAERMFKAGCRWKRADNARVARGGAMGGWDQMRARVNGECERNEAGRITMDAGSQLIVFATCKDFIRTVPVLQHDPNRPEDVNTESEDHAADEARYACMSRPYVRADLVRPKPQLRPLNTVSLDDILRHNDRRRESWV